MGLCNSAEIRQIWGSACNYNLTQVAALIREFKDNNYSYSMTAGTIERLLQLERSQAEAIFSQLQMHNRASICATNLLIALCMIGEPDPQTAIGQDRVAVCFSVFDFHNSGEISKDELTMLLLAVHQTLSQLTRSSLEDREHSSVSQAKQIADKIYKSRRIADTASITRNQLSKFMHATVVNNSSALGSPSNMLEWMDKAVPMRYHHSVAAAASGTSADHDKHKSLSLAEQADSMMARALLEAEMEKGFPCITSQHTSLMAKHLTPACYSQLLHRKTDNRFTIDDAIQAGVRLPKCRIGVIAGDSASYEQFHELLNLVIADWHGLDVGAVAASSGLCMQQTPLLASYQPSFDSPRNHSDFPTQYVKSTRLIFKRNLEGSRLARLNTRGERRTVEHLFLEALKTLADAEEDDHAYASDADDFEDDDVGDEEDYEDDTEKDDDDEDDDDEDNSLRAAVRRRDSTLGGRKHPHNASGALKRWYDGKYYSLTDEELLYHEDLLDCRVLAALEDDTNVKPPFASWQRQAELCVEWEDARGYYLSHDRSLHIAVNTDDHYTFALHHAAGFADPFKLLPQLVSIVKTFQREMIKRGWGFMYHDRLGYLTTCPSFVGTGFVIQMELQLPHLTQQQPWQLEQLLERVGLASVGVVNAESLRVRNMQTFSISETQMLDFFLTSVHQIIDIEEKIAAGTVTLQTVLGQMKPRRRVDITTQHTPRTGRSSCSTRSRIPSTAMLKDLVIDDYPRFNQLSSFIATHLSKRLYQQLKDVVSPSGWTLDQTLRPAIEQDARTRGVIVGDNACYNLFHSFLRLILEVHHPDVGRHRHTSDIRIRQLPRQSLVVADPSLLRGATITCYRCIDNWNFPASLQRAERNTLCKLLADALLQMQDSHSTFTPLTYIGQQTKTQILLPVSWDTLEFAGCLDDWPGGRGVFKTSAGGTSIWVNLVEHIRAITTREDGDLSAAFEEAHDTLLSLSRQLAVNGHKFAFSDRLGFLHPEPAKLGTGMSIDVQLHLPALGSDQPALATSLNRLGLTDVIHPVSDGAASSSWLQFSFGGQIGMSDAAFLQHTIAQINALLMIDKLRQQGEPLTSAIASAMSVKPH